MADKNTNLVTWSFLVVMLYVITGLIAPFITFENGNFLAEDLGQSALDDGLKSFVVADYSQNHPVNTDNFTNSIGIITSEGGNTDKARNLIEADKKADDTWFGADAWFALKQTLNAVVLIIGLASIGGGYLIIKMYAIAGTNVLVLAIISLYTLVINVAFFLQIFKLVFGRGRS